MSTGQSTTRWKTSGDGWLLTVGLCLSLTQAFLNHCKSEGGMDPLVVNLWGYRLVAPIGIILLLVACSAGATASAPTSLQTSVPLPPSTVVATPVPDPTRTPTNPVSSPTPVPTVAPSFTSTSTPPYCEAGRIVFTAYATRRISKEDVLRDGLYLACADGSFVHQIVSGDF